ncbi:MAG: DUF5615 family PIN-like protein [Planctomycetes bacterium]|jgi:hypothetical protein|nr:DUF5615 family PIN-like protein [Planctomycetota bacterium]
MRSEPPALYADENVEGALVRALRAMGWDVVRGIDVHPPGTADEVHFGEAAHLRRVLLSHDTDMLAIAVRWQAGGLAFAGLVFLATRKHPDTRSAIRALRACIASFPESPPANRIIFA